MVAFFDYKIAAGNNNAAGLVNIGTITPSSGILFPEPVARPNYTPGVHKIRLDGLDYQAGYASHVWMMPFLDWRHYDHLRTTYCAGGYSGKVTIRTRYMLVSYANYNAILHLPPPDQILDKNVGWGYNNYIPLTFTRLVAL